MSVKFQTLFDPHLPYFPFPLPILQTDLLEGDVVAFMDPHGHAIAISHENLTAAGVGIELDQIIPPQGESVADIFGFPGYPGPSSRRRRRGAGAESATGTSDSAGAGDGGGAPATMADLRRSLEEEHGFAIRPRLRAIFDEEAGGTGNNRRRKTASSNAGKSYSDEPGRSSASGKNGDGSASKDDTLANMPLKFGNQVEWWMEEVRVIFKKTITIPELFLLF